MGVLLQGSLDSFDTLEDHESESSGSASHGVHLEVDGVDLAVTLEVLLDVGVLGLLGQRAHEQLAVILVGGGGAFAICHLGCFGSVELQRRIGLTLQTGSRSVTKLRLGYIQK